MEQAVRQAVVMFLVYVLSSPFAGAQILSAPMNENLIKGRVKQMDEFFARFNMEETWDGKKMAESKDSAYRAKYLATLFDESRFRRPDGTMKEPAASFIKYVVGHGCRISYEDSTWTAEVACTARVGTARHDIKLFMHTQHIHGSEYKWVIFNVSGRPFELQGTAGKPIISPMEHEVGFVGLASLASASSFSALMLDNMFSADRLSMFAALMGNGLLKIDTVNSVAFHFVTIPGFVFKVERIEKKGSYNTGWLITKLNRVQ